jgi:hypothetical protein
MKRGQMKDKQKSLEELDFFTELTSSELEGINGGAGTSLIFTQGNNPNPTTRPTSPFMPHSSADELPPPWDVGKNPIQNTFGIL